MSTSVPTPYRKLRYRGSYIRGLINNPDGDLVVGAPAADRTLLLNPGTGETVNIDEYRVIGIAFTLMETGHADRFILWKVMYRMTSPELLYLEVNPTDDANISWKKCVELAGGKLGVVNIDTDPHADGPGRLANLGVTGTGSFDFVYFDAGTLGMQTAAADSAIYISMAQVQPGQVYFSTLTYPFSYNSLKSEFVMPGAEDPAGFDSFTPIDHFPGLKDSERSVQTEGAPHVILGIPCPPYWEIIYAMTDSLLISTMSLTSGVGNTVYKWAVRESILSIDHEDLIRKFNQSPVVAELPEGVSEEVVRETLKLMGDALKKTTPNPENFPDRENNPRKVDLLRLNALGTLKFQRNIKAPKNKQKSYVRIAAADLGS